MTRFVASLLVAAMVLYGAPVAAAATDPQPGADQPAKLGGYVFAADGLSPLPGVSVKAAHLETRTVYSSSSTRPDGRYSLTGLPAGTYELAVETPEGLFAARTPVQAPAGQRTLISIAINAKQPQAAGGPSAQDPNAPPAPPDPNAPAPKDPNAPAPKDPNAPATPAKDPNAPAPPEPEPEDDDEQGEGFFRSTWGATLLIFAGALGVAAAANAWADDEEGDDSQPLTQSGN